jgi:hypothetical protein
VLREKTDFHESVTAILDCFGILAHASHVQDI